VFLGQRWLQRLCFFLTFGGRAAQGQVAELQLLAT